MFKTVEANYYYMQGLDNLGKEDLEVIIQQIFSIKESGNESRYGVAQELYEIVSYHQMNHLSNLLGIKYKGKSVSVNELSIFIGNYGFVREWDMTLEIYNSYFFKVTLEELMEETFEIEVDKVGFIYKVYNQYKRVTGKEIYIPVVKKDNGQVLEERYLYMDETSPLEKPHKYEFMNNLKASNKAKEEFFDRIELEDEEYKKGLVKGATTRAFYTLDDILNFYNKPEQQETIDYYLLVLEEGFEYVRRMKQEYKNRGGL